VNAEYVRNRSLPKRRSSPDSSSRQRRSPIRLLSQVGEEHGDDSFPVGAVAEGMRE